MVGGESLTRSNRRAGPGGSLAEWCDRNLPAARFSKLSWLLTRQKAAVEVTNILKKYMKYGATLGADLRRILEKEVDGASDWDKAASPPEPSQSAKSGGVVAGEVRRLEKQLAAAQLAAASAELASKATARRGRSGGRASEKRDKAGGREQGGRGQANAAAGSEYTVVKRQRRKTKKLRPDAAPTTAASVAAAVDIPVEGEGDIPGEGEVVEPKPKPPQWTCPACATEHDWVPKKHCHLCLMLRVVAGPVAQAATTAEEDAVEIAKVQGVIDDQVVHIEQVVAIVGNDAGAVHGSPAST